VPSASRSDESRYNHWRRVFPLCPTRRYFAQRGPARYFGPDPRPEGRGLFILLNSRAYTPLSPGCSSLGRTAAGHFLERQHGGTGHVSNDGQRHATSANRTTSAQTLP
jgi:hypothetical protein